MSGITVSRWHRPHSQFTQISNDFLRAPDIAPSAFRVACYVLSHADAFVLTQERIADALGMARGTVSKAMRELENLGYLITVEVRNDKGHKDGTILYISDTGFTDEERASLCSKIERRDVPSDGDTSEPMRKNCASLCSKIEHHKKTIYKNNTRTPVEYVATDRAREQKEDPVPQLEVVKTTRARPKLRELYEANRAAAASCGICKGTGLTPGGGECDHDPPRGAPARAQSDETRSAG